MTLLSVSQWSADPLSSVGSVRLRSVLITDRGDSRPGQRWRLSPASHWLSALTLPTISTNGEPRRGDRRPKWRKWRRINTLDIIWRGKWWVGEDGVHHFLNKTLHSTGPGSPLDITGTSQLTLQSLSDINIIILAIFN